MAQLTHPAAATQVLYITAALAREALHFKADAQGVAMMKGPVAVLMGLITHQSSLMLITVAFH
jgi:hypothetical protein